MDASALRVPTIERLGARLASVVIHHSDHG